jgi:hypothetical protein
MMIVAFSGCLLIGLGGRHWATAKRSVTTIFERMATTSKDEGVGWCGNIDWVDKDFLIQRTAALVILLSGAFML